MLKMMACMRCARNVNCFSRIAVKRFLFLSSRNLSSVPGETTQQQRESDTKEEADKYEDEDHQLRQRILGAALAFVPQHGWTKKTLSAGAEAEGLPPVAHGMFPRGGADLIHYFYSESNRKLAAILAAEVQELQAQGQEKPKTKPFIEKAVQTRLRMITPYIEQWPQAMAIMTLPQNAVESLGNLASLMDEIWFHAGDLSTDFNWYTKRVSLAGVYKSTEIYMIQDRSEDFANTWQFLDRRLNNLAVFGKAVRNMEQYNSVMMESLLGACIVGRNILGMNSRNR